MTPFFTTDITTDIFARLPAKSAARCRTLSKQWSSILSTPDFAELFLTHSSTRPRLLFAVERNGLWTFFTSPQPQPQPQSSHSTVVTAEFHTKFDGDVSRYLCSYASGLILFPDVWIPSKSDDTNPVVCNPVTGKYATLPYLSIYRKSRAFLGFDPVGKQFKVLSEDRPFCSQSDHHQVLSLGEGGGEELSWRVKDDGPQYDHCLSEAICIEGVLYYLAENFSDPRVVVRFDVRSEEFEFIEAGCFSGEEVAVKLINYKGKVAGVDWKYVKADDEKICHDPNPGPSDIQRGPNSLQKAQVSGSPELVAGATVCRDHVQLVTPDQHPRPPSCSSRRDEAVDTNHTAIGSRTKPLEPPEVSPLRRRETHAPSPFAGAAVIDRRPSPTASPPSPPLIFRFRVYLSSWSS